ncbi:MAG: hypothetical protein ACD_10C00672G0001, partial [uncultured bacterium]
MLGNLIAQFARSECDLPGKACAVHAQFHHLLGQPAQENADQTGQQHIARRLLQISPAQGRRHTEHPRTVRHRQLMVQRIVQRGTFRQGTGNHLNGPGIRMHSPKPVLVAQFGQSIEADILQ